MRFVLFGMILSAVACVTCGIVLAEPVEQDETVEPELTFSLKMGDKSIVLGEGDSAQLEGSFQNPEVSIEVEPYRVFALRGIRFQYPRAFNWEADLSDPNVAIWTLSGSSFKIMFFAFHDNTTAEDIVNSLVGNFEQQGAEVEKGPAEIKLGGKTIAGTQLGLTLVGNKLTDQVFALPSEGTLSRVMIFQDSLDAQGQPSAEGTAALKLFTSSFQVDNAQAK